MTQYASHVTFFYEKGRNGYGDVYSFVNWGIYLFILKITGIKVELLQLHEPVSCFIIAVVNQVLLFLTRLWFLIFPFPYFSYVFMYNCLLTSTHCYMLLCSLKRQAVLNYNVK